MTKRMMDSGTTLRKITDVDWGTGRTGRLVGVQEIAEMTTLTPARVDQLSRQQGFPPPYDVMSAKTRRPFRVWETSVIEAWWAERGGRGGGR
jgi:hypothetical protein